MKLLPLKSVLALLALLPCLAAQAQAQTQSWVPGKGHGSISVAYQDLFVATHTDSSGNAAFPGSISNHSLFFNFDYGLTDRLAMNVGLPYKSNKFSGRGVHNPASLDTDYGQQFLDDGLYHGGWQNWSVGLRYLWRERPLKVTPFVTFGYPSHDYTTFAHSALGTGQKQLQLGLNVGRQLNPPRQNAYFQVGYAYSIMEKVESRRVDHSTFTAEVGYFLTPRLSVNLLASAQKTHHGFEFPGDYPNRRDEHFFHHDQNLRNDFINVSAGLNLQASERYSVFASYAHTVWGENTHLIDRAITLGVARSF